MPEDRTQPPSKRRRQLARERGQVAHSPELTAAVGWALAVLILAFSGPEIAANLVRLVRQPLLGDLAPWADPGELVSRLRGALLGIAWPLGLVIAGFTAGALAAHQMQVRGLWATALIVPDPARLWNAGRDHDPTAAIEKVAGSLLKAVVMLLAAFWAIRAEWTDLERLGELETSALAVSMSRLVLRPLGFVSGVMLVLGLVDYALRLIRFERLLQTTPQEQREDQRLLEGDPALRARRRQIVREWRGDGPELLAGATLLLTGGGGLTLLLADGGSARGWTLRAARRGKAGLRLRCSPKTGGIPMVEAPALALRIVRKLGRTTLPATLPGDLSAELCRLRRPPKA